MTRIREGLAGSDNNYLAAGSGTNRNILRRLEPWWTYFEHR